MHALVLGILAQYVRILILGAGMQHYSSWSFLQVDGLKKIGEEKCHNVVNWSINAKWYEMSKQVLG